MSKKEFVKLVLGEKYFWPPMQNSNAIAPINIALIKYWGKRCQELNLPVTSSISVTIPQKFAKIGIDIGSGFDRTVLNGVLFSKNDKFTQRLHDFLMLFNFAYDTTFDINIETNVPIKAGLASSAAGFCAVTLALNEIFNWNLDLKSLSILARLGSGSSCRSFWPGFVKWHKGDYNHGLDSYAENLSETWPGLCVGFKIISDKEKEIGSTEGMNHTVATSKLYESWPEIIKYAIINLKQAIKNQDFELFGTTIGENSMNMHATMMGAKPYILYSNTKTIETIHKIRNLRKQGLQVYFTQDAGPNLKLFFLKEQIQEIKSHFLNLDICEL